MRAKNQPTKILFISSFPPRKCGIASFTRDLIGSINKALDENVEINVCALDRKPGETSYEYPVSMVLDSEQLDSYIERAAAINKDSSIKLVCIEHEFGLYGGEMGEYLVGFLALIEKPLVIRFHTVLPAPDAKRLKIVQTLGMIADKLIVMTHNSFRLLKDDYRLDPDKISVIPHGTHGKSAISAEDLKYKYRLENKRVLATFGLLSPNKGIETGILAMKEISKKIPNAIYLVLGLTHPNLVKEEGEKYRDYLQQLITENGLRENVRLVNEYVPTRRLMEYLSLTDIYLFTSKDPNQAVSGTFIYAMSAGCPVISNSFVLAEEMLDKDTGIIIEAGNEHQLANNAIRLLQNEPLRKHIGNNAYIKTRDTAWSRVGEKHIALFYDILENPLMKTITAGEITSKH